MINLLSKGTYNYIDRGNGRTMVFLHGLMGGLGNFEQQIDYFVSQGYRVIMPELDINGLSHLKCNINGVTEYVKKFIDSLEIEKKILVGNSLGGHIALNYHKKYPQGLEGIVLTGSSGLYEKPFGETYPRRNDREYIKEKIKDVIYNEELITDALVDDIFEITSNKLYLIKVVRVAKSAIRNNLADHLEHIKIPVCLIWGKNDNVTPPDVAEQFHKFIDDSELFWLDECGHAPMMEKPDEFNSILKNWLVSKNLV